MYDPQKVQYFHDVHFEASILSQNLIGGGCGEGGGSETDTLVGGVEDGVEAFEESETVDEVETLTAGCAKTVGDEVDVPSNTANVSVKGTRPDLGIGSKLKSGSASSEEQRLQF